MTVSSLTYDRQTQTLECLTLGGPPTNLIWSKDNVQLNFFGSEKYSLSQIVIDPLTSLYNNKLKIFNKSKVDSGTYKCSVTNAISEDSVQYTISGNKNLYPSLHFLNSFIFIYTIVCRDGETQLFNTKLDVCSFDHWLSLGQNLPVQAETSQNFSLSLNATSSSVIFNFCTFHPIKSFDMKCSTVSESTRTTIQNIIVQPPSNGTFTNLLSLQSSESYECCVILHYATTGILEVLDLVDQTCEFIATNSTIEESDSSKDIFWTVVILGTGMLVILLLLVLVVGAWVIYCSRINKKV